MLIRVLELPKSSGQFCFNGGNPQAWKEVDWFRDDSYPLNSDSKYEYERMIRGKLYFDDAKAFLVLHPLYSFTINYHAD